MIREQNNESNDRETPEQAPTRRGVPVGVIALVAILVFAAGAAVGFWLLPRWMPRDGHAHDSAKTMYTCPMHPQVVQDKQGTCPICFMDLVPMGGGAGHGDEHADMVHVMPRDRVIAGVKTEELDYRNFAVSIEAPAVVEYDEEAHKVVSARYGGRIERLYVDKTGAWVRKGAPLMDIYSPDLIAAQKEYLIARDTRTVQSIGANNERLLAVSRRRLELLGMTKTQIDALERDGDIAYAITVYSPVSGVVVNRAVSEGAYVGEGSLLLEVVDLSSVWVIANVYENDIPHVRQGIAMTVAGTALGGEVLQGKVQYVYPTVDPQSRTVQVRGVFSNRSGALKPGMYLTSTFSLPAARAVAVPASAVLRTGKRNIVYVEVEENMFEPREIQLGVKEGGYYQVVGGMLDKSDEVVVEGGYLLDSERQLSAPAAGTVHSGHGMEGKSND